MGRDRLRAGVHQLAEYAVGWAIGGLLVLTAIVLVQGWPL